MDTVFNFNSYLPYLTARLGGSQSRTGAKKRAAEALKVHTTLISQVLAGKCLLTLEQAENFSQFLGHGEEESNYFLLLVLKERAGTQALRERFERQLRVARKAHLTLHERVKKDKVISEADQERFYSSYLHSAVHVLVSLPHLKTRPALAQSLGLPLRRVSDSVAFLLQIGVLREKDGLLHPGSRHIHLGQDSRFVGRHHLNWRFKTMDRLQEPYPEDLHYSALVSLSEADAVKVKESLISNLNSNAETILRSKEESAYVYCFDFFRLST